MDAQDKLITTKNREQHLYFGTEEFDSPQPAADEIHLRTYIHRVLRHKWIVIAVTLLATVAAGVYLFREPDVYKSQARVEVDLEGNAGIPNVGKGSSPFDDRAYFNTQLELLESPSLIQRVVKQLDLEHNSDFQSHGFVASSGRTWRVRDAVNYLTGQDAKKEAAPSKRREARRFAEVVKAVKGGLGVEPVLKARQTVKDTRLINITFYHPKPEISVAVANAVADELVASNLKTKMAANSNETDYLQNNIADLENQIRLDEEKLLTFGRSYQLPTQDNSQNTVVDRLVGLNRQLLEAENSRKLAEAEYKAAQAPGAADALAETGTKQIADIDGRLDELRQKRAQLLVEATEKYPEVKEVDGQIAVLEKQAGDKRARATTLYKTNLDTRYRQAATREDSIRRAFNQQRGEMFGQNEAAINYRIVLQSIETNKKLLADMSKRVKENEMLTAKAPNNIRVVDYAMAPTEPIDPKRFQFLGLAFLFSITAGVGLALLRDYFDDSVHSTEEIEKALKLPALAVIPKVGNGLYKQPGSLASNNSLLDTDAAAIVEKRAELLFHADAHSPLAEAFRRLRTAILFSPLVGDLKKILVTSSQPGEGKTTTAVNVATSLAQTGAKVLIIDTDLRSPRLHKIFDVPNYRGLSDIFVEQMEPAEIYTELIKQSNSLYVLPAGSRSVNPAECLGSDQMHNLLRLCERNFDYIVLDSAPVANFVDSTILAAMVDGVLFVVEGNRSSRETVKHSTKLLKMVGAKIVGVVLNKISTPEQRYYGK